MSNSYEPLDELSKLLTPEELEAFDALAEVAGKILRLPHLHPSERGENVRDIHCLQDRILARPAMRALGWPHTDDGVDWREGDAWRNYEPCEMCFLRKPKTDLSGPVGG